MGFSTDTDLDVSRSRTHSSEQTSKTNGGTFNGSSVRTETTEAKPSKFREALASAGLFLKSLFNIKVGNHDVKPVDRESGAKHLLYFMTKSSPQVEHVMVAASKFVKVGEFNTDAFANSDRLDKAGLKVFKNELSQLSDVQLKRLARNFEKNSDLNVNLLSAGAKLSPNNVFDDNEDTDNAISDLGHVDTVMEQLKAALKSEFANRGFAPPTLGPDPLTPPEPSDRLKEILDNVVQDGGVSDHAIERWLTNNFDPVMMQEREKDKIFQEAYKRTF